LGKLGPLGECNNSASHTVEITTLNGETKEGRAGGRGGEVRRKADVKHGRRSTKAKKTIKICDTKIEKSLSHRPGRARKRVERLRAG